MFRSIRANPSTGRTLLRALWSALPLLGLTVISSAAPLYSDDFDVNSAANWNVNKAKAVSGVNTPLLSSDVTQAADFAYDYSQMGIPSAPHSVGGTTSGLRLRSNISGGVQSGLSVSPTGLTLTGGFQMQFDLWSNFVNGGSNSTEAVSAGIGTSGTTTQWAFNPNGALTFATVRDGGTTNTDYRVYTNAGNAAVTTGYYKAGNTTASQLDNTNAYYSFLPTQTVPAAQVTLFPAQAGTTTPVGTVSFAWHTVTILNDGANAIWSIDGTQVAVVPLSAATFSGSNIFVGSFDTNNGSSSGAGQELNFDLIDNLSVIAAPEPTSLSLIALGSLALLRRRRSR